MNRKYVVKVKEHDVYFHRDRESTHTFDTFAHAIQYVLGTIAEQEYEVNKVKDNYVEFTAWRNEELIYGVMTFECTEENKG